MQKIRLLPLVIAGMLVALVTSASAQYPTKPVRLIIPFPPGGSNDVVGRLIATQLGERLGRQVIVDNRSGAGGVIGTEIASQAPKDGYTLAIVSIAHAVNPWLYDLKGRYDPIKSFTPVAILASGPNVLVVNPNTPAKNVNDLIALAKKSPGKVGWAHAGVGSFQHLGGALFELQAGREVPGGAVQRRRAGHDRRGRRPQQRDVLIAGADHAANPVRQAASARRRRVPSAASILPDVPTINEAGVPGYQADNWWGIVAPAGVPQDVVDRLRKEIAAVQGSKLVLEQFAKEGAEVVQMSQAEFGKFMVSEMNKWEKVVKETGMKAQ